MSDLVIRAPHAGLVVPPVEAPAAPEPIATTEAAPATAPPRAARPWRVPEDDDDLAGRATLGKVSGWFLPLG